MELKKDKEYPKGFEKKFCSENCLGEYRKKAAVKERSMPSKGCCH